MKLLALQKQLRKNKMSHLFLLNNDPNFTYFTGLKNLSFSLLSIPQQGKPYLFVNSLDKEKTNSKTKNILIKETLQKTLKKHLKPKTIAYNCLNLTLYSYKKFKKIFPQVKFKDFSQPLQQLRTEKTPSEIFYLKKAAQLTVKAIHQIIGQLKKKKFKTENDLKFFLKKFAYQNNTELSFPPIIASGKNTCHPHHQTSNQKLRRGFLLLDFGLSYQHYCSDMTRMLYLGRPSKRELALYNFLLAIQKNLIKSLKPNLKAKDMEKQARQSLGKYSSYFIHSLGHGVGIEIHESPSLSSKSDNLIKTNSVFTIEPGLYLKNFGFRIEDTILMKEKPVILTKTKKELVTIKF